MPMEYFAIAAGISVHISDTGRQNASNMDKPCILLMHGYLEAMYIWSEFTDLLSEQFRVISICRDTVLPIRLRPVKTAAR